MEKLKRLLALAVSVIVAIIGLGQSMAFADNVESTVKNNAAGRKKKADVARKGEDKSAFIRAHLSKSKSAFRRAGC